MLTYILLLAVELLLSSLIVVGSYVLFHIIIIICLDNIGSKVGLVGDWVGGVHSCHFIYVQTFLISEFINMPKLLL